MQVPPARRKDLCFLRAADPPALLPRGALFPVPPAFERQPSALRLRRARRRCRCQRALGTRLVLPIRSPPPRRNCGREGRAEDVRGRRARGTRRQAVHFRVVDLHRLFPTVAITDLCLTGVSTKHARRSSAEREDCLQKKLMPHRLSTRRTRGQSAAFLASSCSASFLRRRSESWCPSSR